MRQFSSTAPTANKRGTGYPPQQPAHSQQPIAGMPPTSSPPSAAAFALGTFELVSREQGHPSSMPPHQGQQYPPHSGGYPANVQPGLGPAGWTPPPGQPPHGGGGVPPTWQQPPGHPPQQPHSQHQQSSTQIQLPPVPTYFSELDRKRLAELQVMDVDDVTRRAFLRQQESIKTLQELNTSLKQDNLTSCLQHLDAEQVISAMQRDISALQRSAQASEEALRALEARRTAVQQQRSANNLAQKLKAAAAAADRDSERQMDACIEGQGAPEASAGAAQQARWLSSCVSQYIETRAQHHKLLATSQLLKAKGFKGGAPAAVGGGMV